MKKMKSAIWILTSVFIIIMAVFMGLSYNKGYKKGYEKGFASGFNFTIDTVQKIMKQQIHSDTSVTKLILINPDTNVYILQAKSLTNNQTNK